MSFDIFEKNIREMSGQVSTIPFGYCNNAVPTYVQPTVCTRKEKEKAMRYTEENRAASASVRIEASAPQFDATQAAQEHLNARLYEVYHDKREALRKEFNIDEPNGPATVGELRDALANGKYTFTSRFKDDHKLSWAAADQFLSWRTPETQADEDGYKKAKEALKTARQNTRDVIMVLTPAEGLKALQEFEAATFH